MKTRLARFVAGEIRAACEVSLIPLMRWCAKILAPTELVGAVANQGPYVSPEQSPINVYLLNAARMAQQKDPELQANLNAGMEIMRNTEIGGGLVTMFGALITKYQPDEAMYRVCSNALCLGWYARGLLGAENTSRPETSVQGETERAGA